MVVAATKQCDIRLSAAATIKLPLYEDPSLRLPQSPKPTKRSCRPEGLRNSDWHVLSAVTAFGQTCSGHPYLAEFGQTEFGQYHIWPKLTGRIWPSKFDRIWPNFVDRFWPDRIWPIFCFDEGPEGWGPEGVGAHRGGGPGEGGQGVGALRGGGPNSEKVGPEGWGARRVGGPKGGGPEGWGLKGGGPKISLFFFSPTGKFILSSLSGGFLVVFWWCLKRRDAQMCAFGVLWLSCEAPTHKQAPPTGTTSRHHQQAPPTGTTNRHHHRHHQQAPTGTNKQQQATTKNNNNQEKQQQQQQATTTRNKQQQKQ